jgi:choline transport protein
MKATLSDESEKAQEPAPDYGETVPDIAVGEFLNVSGHPQELDRNLGFWSICAISIVADDAWAAGAGSLVWQITCV